MRGQKLELEQLLETQAAHPRADSEQRAKSQRLPRWSVEHAHFRLLACLLTLGNRYLGENIKMFGIRLQRFHWLMSSSFGKQAPTPEAGVRSLMIFWWKLLFPFFIP